MHSVFQCVSKGIFYFVRIKLLSWKPHVEAPRVSRTDSLFWNVLVTDFAAARFPLCSLLSQPRRSPCRLPWFPEPRASPAACGKAFPTSPEPRPLGWLPAARIQGGNRPSPPSALFYLHLPLLVGRRPSGDTGFPGLASREEQAAWGKLRARGAVRRPNAQRLGTRWPQVGRAGEASCCPCDEAGPPFPSGAVARTVWSLSVPSV